MIKRIFSFSVFFAAGALMLLSGCRKEKDLTDQVNKMDFTSDMYEIQSSIDQWLYTNITLPYNIRIQYKWDRSEADLNKALTPIEESRVIPTTEKIITYFLKPYEAEAGAYFIKRYPPKEIFYVGSPQYNSNGTVKTGSADAGRKISLFRLNQINENDFSTVQRMLKTVHHEFAHILDQNKSVPVEFGLLAKADYVDDTWADYSDQDAYDHGFISPYARSQESDDFAETVAILLVYGQQNFEDILDKAAPAGKTILMAKEQMVIDYFDMNWGINFTALQQRIQDAFPQVQPPVEPDLPDFLTFYGYGLQFEYALADQTNLEGESLELYNSFVDEELQAENRVVREIRLHYNPDDGQMFVRIYRFAAGAGTDGSASYSRIFYDVHGDPEGTITLTQASGGNDSGEPKTTSSSLANTMSKFTNFMLNNQFKLDWIGTDMTKGGLVVVDDDGNETGIHFGGKLSN